MESFLHLSIIDNWQLCKKWGPPEMVVTLEVSKALLCTNGTEATEATEGWP